MSNILKNEIDCTCKEFLNDVYGVQSKPCDRAVRVLFTSVLTQSSTLIKTLSAPLRTANDRLEGKRVQEMVSRWLVNYDFEQRLNPYLLRDFAGTVGDRTTLAVDFSDISKEFGGAGMEGMEMGWDGSRGCVAMGHDFISVSVVGSEHREALPVYVKLGKGRHRKDDLLYEAIRTVMLKTHGRGWLVLDRGMDDEKFIHTMKRNNWNAVVRIKDMKRDVFGNGKDIGVTLEGLRFGRALLNTYRGAIRAEVRCAIGIMQYCPEPHVKDAATDTTRLLVVESRFDDRSIYLYVICPDCVIDDPQQAWEYAVRAAQAYCDRWQIETSFQTVKQEFRLEEARVRRFCRLVNVFALCILAYVFTIQYLRSSKRFRKIVKALGDNVKTLALKTHSLLCGIRELYRAGKVRFITGRPRKRFVPDAAQLLLALE